MCRQEVPAVQRRSRCAICRQPGCDHGPEDRGAFGQTQKGGAWFTTITNPSRARFTGLLGFIGLWSVGLRVSGSGLAAFTASPGARTTSPQQAFSTNSNNLQKMDPHFWYIVVAWKGIAQAPSPEISSSLHSKGLWASGPLGFRHIRAFRTAPS